MEHKKENAALWYKEEKITFSEAAHRAGLTLWDMKRFFIDKGIVSDYSIDDLEREIAITKKSK